jgi:hypothetical protein
LRGGGPTQTRAAFLSVVQPFNVRRLKRQFQSFSTNFSQDIQGNSPLDII